MTQTASLEEYKQYLKPTLEAFELYLKNQVATFEPEIRDVVAGVITHPGKRLRPSFVFAISGEHASSEKALRMAAICELIHLATLVHDDILDGALSRHGAVAHHIQFTPQISVLTGDTLFLRANELAAMEDELWVGRAVAAAAKATCSGEIAQGLAALRGGKLTFEAYERQLLGKTGKLFGLSCVLGGYIAGVTAEQRAGLATYGEAFGIAYQLYDDAVDLWGTEAEYKKTLGTDQSQHKWTLPWILLEKKLGEAALEPLWDNRAEALKVFAQHKIAAECTAIFEGYLNKARNSIKGLPCADLLAAPLAYVNSHWKKLAV